MTGCYSNGVWRCRWGLFFTSSQLLDTYTQTHSHVHTRGHLLYDTVLFSVCFTLKWFPPAGYCFTFVTHSTASTALSSYSPVSPKHTCVHTLICNEKHKYTHIHTHTITACRLAALLWFPSASSRSWGENEWEGCCSPGHKKRRRRNTEGGEKKTESKLWPVNRVWSANQQGIQRKEEELGEGPGRWRWIYTARGTSLCKPRPATSSPRSDL